MGKIPVFTVVLFVLTLASTSQIEATLGTQHANEVFGSWVNELAETDNVKPEFTLQRAVAKVRKHTKGKILTAETVQVDQRYLHRIKVLMPDGLVKVFLLDGVTGDFLQ